MPETKPRAQCKPEHSRRLGVFAPGFPPECQGKCRECFTKTALNLAVNIRVQKGAWRLLQTLGLDKNGPMGATAHVAAITAELNELVLFVRRQKVRL